MKLPEFLKDPIPQDPTPEFTDALRRYREQFKVGVSTAELTMSKEEIIEMIDECIATGVTWEEYLDAKEYDEDTDY